MLFRFAHRRAKATGTNEPEARGGQQVREGGHVTASALRCRASEPGAGIGRALRIVPECSLPFRFVPRASTPRNERTRRGRVQAVGWLSPSGRGDSGLSQSGGTGGGGRFRLTRGSTLTRALRVSR